MTTDLLNKPHLLRESRRKRSRAALGATGRKVVLPIATAIAVLAVWEVAVRVSGIQAVILPPPSKVLNELVRQREILLDNAVPTTIETVGGFVLAVVLGGLLGTLMTYSRLARDALYPNVILFQLMPKVAVAPLFMLWLGIDWESRVAVAVFIAFFPMVISTSTGLSSVDPALLRLCQSLTATKLQVFFQVRLPSSLPFLFNGMKISMTLAVIGVVVGEFITSQKGLGYIIIFAGSRLETALVMAAIFVLCIVGLVLYGVVAMCEYLIIRRYGK